MRQLSCRAVTQIIQKMTGSYSSASQPLVLISNIDSSTGDHASENGVSSTRKVTSL